MNNVCFNFIYLFPVRKINYYKGRGLTAKTHIFTDRVKFRTIDNAFTTR